MPTYRSRIVKPNSYKGQSLAVFTSGGDSQGMNAAVRAVVRMGIYLGIKVYFIYEGYQGMVDGGEFIAEARWDKVSSIIHKGGTVIGSARCMDFKERTGRLKAAFNLIKLGINNLVCIGGDGSLTGANCFRQEWVGLTDELLKTNRITQAEKNRCRTLQLTGLVGSIDNDFCGTDMTIGTDSALFRIVEAIDAITSTAHSHKRTFVMEVMGRHCGYLALVAGLACEADYVFIPELPDEGNWKDNLCEKCSRERSSGQRLSIIIVSEGALDKNGDPITANEVKDVLTTRLKHDTRVTILGHVQRGGNTSAFDRILGCRMGAESVLALMEQTEETEPCIIALKGNAIIRLPLMECVRKTQSVAKAMEEKKFQLAVQLRGDSFKRNLDTYKLLNQIRPSSTDVGFALAIMHVGAPACGMNAAVRSFVRYTISRGGKPYAIYDGIEGLLAGNIKLMDWTDVVGWVSEGGAKLGTKKTLPGGKCKEIAARLQEFKIQALLIVGGFEAYLTALTLGEARSHNPGLCIPLVVVPCTINNNVPGTEISLGSDTALNEISIICDRIKQSALGTKRRIFVVETFGGYCGYLATLAGMAGGADCAYIHEEKLSIKDLQTDLYHLANKMCGGCSRGLILRNDKANENYTSDFIYRLYSEEGKGLFSTRMNILGHMQQGSNPSPFDRNLGTQFAYKALEWMWDKCTSYMKGGKVFCDSNDSCVVVGVLKKNFRTTPAEVLRNDTNFELRTPRYEWWLRLRPLLRILAKYGAAASEEEGLLLECDDVDADGDNMKNSRNVSRKSSVRSSLQMSPMSKPGCSCGR